MFNSDNILWTSNEKNAFAKNRIYHIERPLSTRDASYTWDCWHDIFCLLTQENAKLYELYLIYPICFVNKCVWLPLFLSRFEGLRYVKSNSSVSGNTTKECSFQRILINIPQQPTKDASIEYSFLFAFLHYYYLVFIKSVSYSIDFGVWHDSIVEVQKKWIIKKCSTIGWNPFKPNLSIINQIKLHCPACTSPQMNNLNWIKDLFDYLFR